MSGFRFAIMGAGGIAVRFCRAVREISGAEIAAVASKSAERARSFAEQNGISVHYASYVEMLHREKPDCVYIATTPDQHAALTMLCMENDVPVLCEKAMFTGSLEAKRAFALSEEKKLFCMEALWSRFLPANRQARYWLEQGKIGKLSYMDIKIGFPAPRDKEKRYFNPALCGGASTDLTCYSYELARFYADGIAGEEPICTEVHALPAETGVDLCDHITLMYPGLFATLFTSFDTALEESAVLYGTEGKIVIPHPHYATDAYLFRSGREEEHFRDSGTPDGFAYEIRETISCIRQGKWESEVVPHRITLDCACVLDGVAQEIRQREQKTRTHKA